MRAMILAAGRGSRMQALTDKTPKPLLRAGEKYLIEYALQNVIDAGVKEVVINISYHANQIKAALGDGKKYGIQIIYSEEHERLETGGGIFQALPHLGDEPFYVISSDIITDFPLASLGLRAGQQAKLVVVPNPPYHEQGDFALANEKIQLQGEPRYTYASLGIFSKTLFAACHPGHFRLTDVLNPAILAGKVDGEIYHGEWYNIGTPQDLIEHHHRAREDSNLRPLASETNTLSN
jgi:N-acetyl-alpha-D-muramate 1-phosphate uridylyltransferase